MFLNVNKNALDAILPDINLKTDSLNIGNISRTGSIDGSISKNSFLKTPSSYADVTYISAK